MSQRYTKEELLSTFQPIKLKDFFSGNNAIPYLMFDHQELFVTNTQDPENGSTTTLSTNNIDNNGNTENASSSSIIVDDFYPSDRQEIFYKFTINGKARARNSGNSQKGLSNLKNISSATSSRNGSFMQTSMCSSNTPGGSKRNSNSSVQIKRSSKNYIQDIITECRRGSGTKRSDSPALQIESSQKRNSRTIIAPFSQSPMMKSIQLEERGWFYVDEQECIQGPFTSIEMDNWYLKGYFLPTLLVGFKNTNKKLFFQLETLYQPPKQHIYLNREVKEFLKTEKSNFKKRSSSFGVSSTICRRNKQASATGYYGYPNANGDSPSSVIYGKNIRRPVRHSSILNSTPRACLRMEEMINQLISKQSGSNSFNGFGCIGDSKKSKQKRNSNNLILTNQTSSQQKSSEVFTSENEYNEEYNINENEDNNSTNATPLANKKRLSDSLTDDKEYISRISQRVKENKKVKDFPDKFNNGSNQIEEDYYHENKEQNDQFNKWRTDKSSKEKGKSSQKSPQKPQISNAQLLLSKRTETQELE